MAALEGIGLGIGRSCCAELLVYVEFGEVVCELFFEPILFSPAELLGFVLILFFERCISDKGVGISFSK